MIGNMEDHTLLFPCSHAVQTLIERNDIKVTCMGTRFTIEVTNLQLRTSFLVLKRKFKTKERKGQQSLPHQGLNS